MMMICAIRTLLKLRLVSIVPRSNMTMLGKWVKVVRQFHNKATHFRLGYVMPAKLVGDDIEGTDSGFVIKGRMMA